MENKLKKKKKGAVRGGDKPAHNVLNMLSYSFLLCYNNRAKTFEQDILYPDRLINLEINNKRRASVI